MINNQDVIVSIKNSIIINLFSEDKKRIHDNIIKYIHQLTTQNINIDSDIHYSSSINMSYQIDEKIKIS